MKRTMYRVLGLLALVAMVFVVAAATGLTEWQVILVGVIASFVSQIFMAIFKWFGWVPGDVVKVIFLWIVGLVVGYFFLRPTLPATGDPAELSAAILNAAMGIVGIATSVYKVLLQDVVFPAMRLAEKKPG